MDGDDDANGAPTSGEEGRARREGKWHRLRHTFCSHLAMRGAAAIEIKELAGHQSIATTNRYMHLAPERRRTAMALLETARGESVARSS